MEICAVLFTCLVAGLALTQAYPLHASCKVQWSLPSVSCQSFSSKIVAQAKLWEKEDNCASGGERCLYKITDQSAQEIKGTHMTPVKHYVDDISFKLTPAGAGCNVEGFSTSETWYAYLDYGTNYCNLENLITGAGLNTSQGYTETTNDNVCTQFSSHDCDKY